MKTRKIKGQQKLPATRFKGALFTANKPKGMLLSDGIDFSDIQKAIGWTMIIINISLIIKSIELSLVLHLSPYIIDIRQEVDNLISLSFDGMYISECIICNTLIYLADIAGKDRRLLPILSRINLIIGIIMLISFVSIIIALSVGDIEKDTPFKEVLINNLITQRIILYLIVGRATMTYLRIYDENKII